MPTYDEALAKIGFLVLMYDRAIDENAALRKTVEKQEKEISELEHQLDDSKPENP